MTLTCDLPGPRNPSQGYPVNSGTACLDQEARDWSRKSKKDEKWHDRFIAMTKVDMGV